MGSGQWIIEEKAARPDPILERAGEGMFTDREVEMASLMKWVNLVGQKAGRSRALISHRRHGKTAIMERFYNRLFWERDDVMPFYYELTNDKIWINDFARDYFRSFLQQFLAFRTRDAKLAFEHPLPLEQIRSLAEKVDEPLVLENLDYWESVKDSIYLSEIIRIFRDTPHIFAARTGLSIIVMFDEFQRLDQVLYHDREQTRKCQPYTQSFSAAAESTHAPMLIAGSEVTILKEQALSGAMLGRVATRNVKRLPLEGGAELALKFAQRNNINLSLDSAYTISSLVDGHPYYIWALFSSEDPEADLTTEEGIKNLLTFEIEDRDGYINKFWRYNFLQNMTVFGSPHAKQIIFYLTQYQKSEVRVEKVVEDLKLSIPLEEASQKLRELVWCDLIREESGTVYGGLTDPMLERVLRAEYSWEIEQLTREEVIEKIQDEFTEEIIAAKDALIASLRGELSSWTGRFAEMFIDKLMKLFFKGQVVDGSDYFNKAGEVHLSRFSRVYNTVTQPEGAPTHYQIDLYGIPSNQQPKTSNQSPATNNQSPATNNQSPATNNQSPATNLPWIVEVKNWERSISGPQVEYFWNAAQNLAEERGHDQIICWFYARGGFTGPAEKFMREKEMLYTDQAGLVKLLQDLQVVEQWNSQ